MFDRIVAKVLFHMSEETYRSLWPAVSEKPTFHGGPKYPPPSWYGVEGRQVRFCPETSTKLIGRWVLNKNM